MRIEKRKLLVAILLASGVNIFAQNTPVTNTTITISDKKARTTAFADEESSEPRNFNYVKLNITNLALKTYSLQLERTLSKKISAAVSFRIMPNTAVPFQSQISNAIGDNSSGDKDLIDNLELSNYAITPEIRFYTGKKGYGRGFYIAPFYRYASYKTNTLRVDFTGETGQPNSLNLSGSLNTNTAGILFGAQWPIGSHFCIDWWIAGPHYGAGKGTFIGLSDKPLTQREQDELKRQINDLNIPFSNKTVSVNSAGATMQLDGPWAGVRAGLCFGVKF